MDGDHSDIANDQLHKFLGIVACIGGNSRELKLEGITAEYVEEYRIEYAEEKLRQKGEPKKKIANKPANDSPQELKRMR